MAAGRLRVFSRWLGPVMTPSAVNLKPVAPRLPSAFCRSASSRRVGKPRSNQNKPRTYDYDDVDDEHFNTEDAEDKVAAVIEEVKRKQKMIKYNILRKKMMPPGAPERNLTWDAMETIRYLKREHPDEWTVARLSEGFSVSDDVIRRVLRTKFTPAPQRREMQDAKVMSRLQHPMLSPGTAQSKQVLSLGTAQSKQMLSSGTAQSKQMLLPGTAQSKPALSPGKAQSKPALSPGTAQSKPALQAGGPLHQPKPSRNPETALIPVALHESEATTDVSALVTGPETMPNRCEDSAEPTKEAAQITSAHNDVAKEEEALWDGQVFSEEELDEFKDIEPTPVLQHGHDFFDSNGQFLYRI
ncbi:neugrin [Stigmatopora nigra]